MTTSLLLISGAGLHGPASGAGTVSAYAQAALDDAPDGEITVAVALASDRGFLQGHRPMLTDPGAICSLIQDSLT